MNDQADNLRKAIERLGIATGIAASDVKPGAAPPPGSARHSGPARVIAVSSGKGGVGKTSVSVNLALAFSEMNLKPLLVDADVGLANVEVLFGIFPKYNLLDAVNNEKTVREIVFDGPNGVKLISGGSGVEVFTRMAETRMAPVISELAELDDEYDIIIIDTGAGISETVLGMAVAADEAVVVTTPEPTSVTDAYALIKAIVLRDRDKTVRLIINKAESEFEAAEVMSKLSQVTDKFLDLKLHKLGYILNDPLVVRSVKQQQPFILSAPNSQAAKKIRDIARRLAERTVYAPAGAAQERGRGLSGFLGAIAKFVNVQLK